MKKYLFGLLALMGSVNSFAAAGDTTWVQATVAELGGYGSYDSVVTFPTGGSYRNIYMIVTLGKYVCPGTPMYCGDWDYTVQNYLIAPGGETFELGRLITPYANSGAPRTIPSWTQRYVYDVTDYASKLQGTNTIRLFFSGYSGGFTGNIKFAFVEGIPERNVIGIERLWNGSFGYGGPTFNTHFAPVSKTAPNGTVSAELKFTVTGHGSDANGCCEFLSNNYQVMLDGSSVANTPIWRSDCGMNELYPQSGTWPFDRGNWCPGASVNSNHHVLPGVTAGSNFNVALLFDPYVGGGSYTTEAHLIYYGDYNRLKDAAIIDIISPTNNENHFRENPICSSPVIRVKNKGGHTITLMEIEYGVNGSGPQTYTWAGSLNPLESSDITLPDLPTLQTIAGGTVAATFSVKIKTVNGTKDADSTNDKMSSAFMPSPLWDGKFRIVLKTNNEATTGSLSETTWKIYNSSNIVVKERNNTNINALYTDTVSLPTGCYKLEVNDGSCDGLHFWYWQAASSPINDGYVYVRKLSTSTNIPMNGYSYSGTYNNDFGCQFTQYFYTNTPTGVTDIDATGLSMTAYPNPASNVVYVEFAGMTEVKGTINIIDVMGRLVKTTTCTEAHKEINTDGMANGIYTILFVTEGGNKLQTRLMIAK